MVNRKMAKNFKCINLNLYQNWAKFSCPSARVQILNWPYYDEGFDFQGILKLFCHFPDDPISLLDNLWHQHRVPANRVTCFIKYKEKSESCPFEASLYECSWFNINYWLCADTVTQKTLLTTVAIDHLLGCYFIKFRMAIACLQGFLNSWLN